MRQPREARLRGGVHPPERVVVELARLGPRCLGRRGRRVDAGVAEQLNECGLEPRREVHAVRDVPDLGVDLLERGPHLARDLAVQLRDAVREGRQPQRHRRQPELVVVAECAECEQLRRVEAGACSERPDVVRDQLLVEDLVACRYRRMCREDARALDLRDRIVGRYAHLDECTHALDRQERGVPFVHVEDVRLDAERGERTHAANAEQQLLTDAMRAVAGVERVGQPFGFEQVERDAADVLAPDGCVNRVAVELDVDVHGLPHETGSRRIDRLVPLGLPAGVVDALVEVAGAVEQPDADERDPELRRGFQVVAGEHAEAARVDRQLVGERELHREVGDVGVAVRVRTLPPGRRFGRRHRRAAGRLSHLRRGSRAFALRAEPRHERALPERLLALRGRGRLGEPNVRAFVPEVDVQPLDLLHEHRDRATGGSHFLARVTGESVAPDPQGLDLRLVEALLRLRAHSAAPYNCVTRGTWFSTEFSTGECARVCAETASFCRSGAPERATRCGELGARTLPA